MAHDLDDGRSAVACLARYRQLERSGGFDKNGDSVASEHTKLRQEGGTTSQESALITHGALEHGATVKEHHQQQLGPEDLQRLGMLVQQHGRRWSLVAEEFGGGYGRHALMYFWRRAKQRGELDQAPGRRGKWTQAEDDSLQRVLFAYGC